MMQRTFMLLVVSGAMVLASGCKSLFPSKSTTVESRWKSYEEVSGDFEKILPNQTDSSGLKALGFDPAVSANVKILTYVDLIQIFMPNSGIQKDDLAAPVRECIEARGASMAYAIDLQVLKSKRYGNLFLDIFGFKKKTHNSGWDFKGLILIKNGVVVYKLSSGEPNISSDEKVVRPLGPLQELDGVFFSVAGKIK